MTVSALKSSSSLWPWILLLKTWRETRFPKNCHDGEHLLLPQTVQAKYFCVSACTDIWEVSSHVNYPPMLLQVNPTRKTRTIRFAVIFQCSLTFLFSCLMTYNYMTYDLKKNTKTNPPKNRTKTNQTKKQTKKPNPIINYTKAFVFLCTQVVHLCREADCPKPSSDVIIQH